MANTNLPLVSNSDPKSCPSMELGVVQERLRQARLSFNLALVLTAISGIISLAGLALFLSGKVREGTVTTAGGLASNVVSMRCLKLTKDANDRLDKIVKDLDED